MASTILYTCLYIPPEWIAAHGLRPERLLPSSAGIPAGSLLAGMCPYAQAFTYDAGRRWDARAIIVSTLCDQMRRGAELLAGSADQPVFLFNMPSTCGQTAQTIYRQELERLGVFLTELGGSTPTADDLLAQLEQYETRRRVYRNPHSATNGRRYAEGILELLPIDENVGEPAGIPLALVGAPLVRDAFVLFDLIEKAGGRVALNATETGEIALPAPFEMQRAAADPLGELVHAYLMGIPHPSRRPDDLLFDRLAELLPVRGIRGIILIRYLWCDFWHAMVQRLKEWSPVPVIELDLSAEDGTFARSATRIESLLEMVR